MTAIDFIGWLIAALAALNTIFLWDASRRWYNSGWHPIIGALWTVKVMVWLVGIPFAIISLRYVMGLNPLPWGGSLLAIGIVGLLLLPALIWVVLRRFRY